MALATYNKTIYFCAQITKTVLLEQGHKTFIDECFREIEIKSVEVWVYIKATFSGSKKESNVITNNLKYYKVSQICIWKMQPEKC